MSKVVKAVAGIALISMGIGGILGFAGVQFGTSVLGAQILTGVSTLAGASLLGSALAPSIADMLGADSHAGQALQTRKDNTSAVPQVFGEVRVGSNIIWQGSNSAINGFPNKDYWSVQAISEAEINSFEEMYANEDTMVNKGSNIFTTEYAHIKGYTTSGNGMLLSEVDFVKDSAGNIAPAGTLGYSFDYTQLSSSTNSTQLVNLLDGDHETYWENGSGQSPIYPCWVELDAGQSFNLTELSILFYKRENKKAKFRAEYWDGTSWTDGSGWCTISWGAQASHTWYNLSTNVATNELKWRVYFEYLYNDWDSDYDTPVRLMEFDIKSNLGTNITIPPNIAFIAMHQTFDATDNAHTQLDNITAKIQGKKIDGTYTNNPATIIEHLLIDGLNIDSSDIDSTSISNAETKCNSYGYTADIVFNSQANIQSAIQTLLATCRGQIVYSQGKWKLKMDEKSATVVKALTSDDILNSSLNISMKGFQEIANKIDLKYINPNDNWLSAKVEKQDSDLISLDGQTITKTLDVKGITNTAQANKLAEITLNSMRYTEDASGNRIKQTPLAISFATTIKNAELEVGDVFSLEHSLLDRVRKFVILSVETDQSGAIQVSAREYCETHYKDSSNNYII